MPKRNFEANSLPDIERDGGRFVFVFATGWGKKRTEHRFSVPRYWLAVMGERIWGAVNKEQADLDHIKKKLRGE